MKKNQLKNFILITVLILATGGAMAYSSNKPGGFFSNWISGSPHPHTGNDEILKASGHLVQNKVLLGSDGTVGLSLTLQAEDLAAGGSPEARNVDMVIVLDRSGSMQGHKLKDARRAGLKLLSNLSAKDRFAMPPEVPRLILQINLAAFVQTGFRALPVLTQEMVES